MLTQQQSEGFRGQEELKEPLEPPQSRRLQLVRTELSARREIVMTTQV